MVPVSAEDSHVKSEEAFSKKEKKIKNKRNPEPPTRLTAPFGQREPCVSPDCTFNNRGAEATDRENGMVPFSHLPFLAQDTIWASSPPPPHPTHPSIILL